jgi:hypothetical protein
MPDTPIELNDIAPSTRDTMVARNRYNPANRYEAGHPDVISDGDDKGRDDIGNSIDIEQRNVNSARNYYSKARPYTGPRT